MELIPNAGVPDGLRASMTLLSEKPRLGVPNRESALHPGIDERNCTALLGLRFRSSEIASGTVDAPSNGFFHNLACSLAAPLIAAAGAANGTVGAGVGGSVGVGFGFGGSVALSVQAVADSSGNAGIAINVNPGFFVWGASAMAGLQGSVSSSKSISGLAGWSFAGDVSAGAGPAGDLGVSQGINPISGPLFGGATTVTYTSGPGVGTKAAVGSVGYTFVPKSLSTSCGKG